MQTILTGLAGCKEVLMRKYRPGFHSPLAAVQGVTMSPSSRKAKGGRFFLAAVPSTAAVTVVL